ncbi:hypothetical protein QBC34DRAFT_47497 [Podospora aff. communis PSN243]|uniref:Uncharacterized protein n=1 Tax=Podospora aff. communis PSN243 TaxID=3040156 RepID=A0AAV9GWY8_9PEZI|nr:hypothetical protein QBC34DRAFT_47497 [Podospora aff. communis PSN243]
MIYTVHISIPRIRYCEMMLSLPFIPGAGRPTVPPPLQHLRWVEVNSATEARSYYFRIDRIPPEASMEDMKLHFRNTETKMHVWVFLHESPTYPDWKAGWVRVSRRHHIFIAHRLQRPLKIHGKLIERVETNDKGPIWILSDRKSFQPSKRTPKFPESFTAGWAENGQGKAPEIPTAGSTSYAQPTDVAQTPNPWSIQVPEKLKGWSTKQAPTTASNNPQATPSYTSAQPTYQSRGISPAQPGHRQYHGHQGPIQQNPYQQGYTQQAHGQQQTAYQQVHYQQGSGQPVSGQWSAGQQFQGQQIDGQHYGQPGYDQQDDVSQSGEPKGYYLPTDLEQDLGLDQPARSRPSSS